VQVCAAHNNKSMQKTAASDGVIKEPLVAMCGAESVALNL
jgi:hypothetical protein